MFNAVESLALCDDGSATEDKLERVSLNLSSGSLAFLDRLHLSVLKQDLIFFRAWVLDIHVQVLRGMVSCCSVERALLDPQQS